MALLDRYLQAVKFWLPKAQREDVAAELLEEVRSQMGAREAELGRKLTEGEQAEMLERLGNPLLVAERYLPPRFLIGPALFPAYRLALKATLFFYLLPWLLVWVGLLIFSPSYREAHPGLAALDALVSWWLIAIHAFLAITLLFAFAGRSEATPAFLERWKHGKTPVAEVDAAPRAESIAEWMAAAVFILWWLGVVRFPAPEDLLVTLAPIWRTLHWPLLVYSVASAVVAFGNTFRPRWTRRRAAARLAVDAAGVVLMGVLLGAGHWLDLSVAGASPFQLAKLAELETWANLSLRITLLVIGGGLLLRGVQDVRRIKGAPPFRHWTLSMFAAG